MSLLARRRDAARAERHLHLERVEWQAQTRTLQTRVEQHRETWIVAGGLIGGMACGLLPLRGLLRAGDLLASAFALAMRSPLAALFAASAASDRTDDAGTDT
jgi:hypothetical protein